MRSDWACAPQAVVRWAAAAFLLLALGVGSDHRVWGQDEPAPPAELPAAASLPSEPAAEETTAAEEPAPADEAAPAAGPTGEAVDLDEAQRRAEAALAAEEPAGLEAAPAPAGRKPAEPKMNVWELARQGGIIMYPIYFVSFLVVVFTVERLLGLRTRKVLPPRLLRGLNDMAKQQGGLNPRHAYKLCKQYPSAAANVIKAMLLKVGRPHAEVEHTVVQATEREAARLYGNVRWLNLATGVAPLLGLLGTVSGMIKSFFITSTMDVAANRSQALAEGIYEALVTTFAGLCVAIPAAVLAHYFEGRIQRLFRELDETLMGLMPQLERFEGRLRVHRDELDQPTLSEAVPRGEAGKAGGRLPARPGKDS